MTSVCETIIQFITKANVQYKHVQHEPTYTCEESAKARNESLSNGAKSILMKLDNSYALFVLSAALKLDSRKIKAIARCSSIRFATAEELLTLTSLVPGSVPPFGKPILPFSLYIDFSIKELPQVAFNAGSLSDSIILETNDYLGLCDGVLCSFSK